MNWETKKRAWTLIELVLFLTLLALVLYGAMTGAARGGKHGVLLGIGGFFAGGAAGLAVFFGGLFALWAPFALVGAIMRVASPANLMCRCDASTIVPEHLAAQTPEAIRAVEESRRLHLWHEYSHVVSRTALNSRETLKLVGRGGPSVARIGLAASLGKAVVEDLKIIPVEPMISFPNYAKLPKDLWLVLRSGLPPRLCVAWALVCVEHVLPIFEQEFHQDTRPRQFCGIALMVLRDGKPDALEPWKDRKDTWFNVRKAGCRVLHRGWWERAIGSQSKGEHAVMASFLLLNAIRDFLEPSYLWRSYPDGDIGNGYATPASRCELSQPAYLVADIAGHASRAAADRDAELNWQRAQLAEMILHWRRWHEDRNTWRRSLEKTWIPRVLNELKNVRFDVPEYAGRVRRELAPWAPAEDE